IALPARISMSPPTLTVMLHALPPAGAVGSLHAKRPPVAITRSPGIVSVKSTVDVNGTDSVQSPALSTPPTSIHVNACVGDAVPNLTSTATNLLTAGNSPPMVLVMVRMGSPPWSLSWSAIACRGHQFCREQLNVRAPGWRRHPRTVG